MLLNRIPFRVWAIGTVLAASILLIRNYGAIESFLFEFWFVALAVAFAGMLVSAYLLGVQRGSPTYIAAVSEAPEAELVDRTEIDMEVSIVVNEQAATIMQLEEQLALLMSWYSTLKAKADHAEAMRKKWYRLYRTNTRILKAFIANPAMTLPRTWRRYQLNLLADAIGAHRV